MARAVRSLTPPGSVGYERGGAAASATDSVVQPSSRERQRGSGVSSTAVNTCWCSMVVEVAKALATPRAAAT